MSTRKYYKGEIEVDGNGILYPKTTIDCIYDSETGIHLNESLSKLASKDELDKKAGKETVLSIASIINKTSDWNSYDLYVYSHDPSALIGLRNGTRQITSEASFTFDTTTQTITSYIGTDKDVIIPAKINGITVKYVGQNAFKNKKLSMLSLPSTIVDIGNSMNGTLIGNSFEYMYLPPLITTLKGNMFANMKSLSKIIFPSCVTKILISAFARCNLKEVEFPDMLQLVEGSAFEGNSIKKITLPNSVTTLGTAFKNCGMEVLKLSDNITQLDIGTAAVYGWQGNKLKLLIWQYPSTAATDTVLSALTYAAENSTGAITIRTTKTEFIYNLIANSAIMSAEQKAQYTVTDMQGVVYTLPVAEV